MPQEGRILLIESLSPQVYTMTFKFLL